MCEGNTVRVFPCSVIICGETVMEVARLRSTLTRHTILLLILTTLLVGVVGCGRQERPAGGKILVAASIAPMYSFAKGVGGDHVEVELLVPAGASPHTYQLTPRQMETLSKASVLVLNGAELEFWADKAADAADNQDLLVVETADGLKLIDDLNEHAEHEGCEHEGGNPHVWLDPVKAVHQVEKIRDALVKADPENEDQYQQNAGKYIKELQTLDADISKQTSSLSSRQFVAFHSAWVYFAQRYGLEQVAVVEESPGKEPSVQHIKGIVDTVRKSNVKIVIAEPQFSPKAAQVIADESGAKVITLDPLGQPPSYDYIKTMRNNVNKLTEALK